MGFYVPWAIEHSSHPARLARRMLQQQKGEGSGIDRPGDLKVQALNTPGNGFRVSPGGGIAQSRDTSVSARESYGPINDAEIVIMGVPGTGSGQTRRDLVILEITDPEMESVTYPEPTDPEYTGGWQQGDTFCRITVIPNVGVGVKSLDQITTGPYANVTGITLAAINWLPNTSTIGNGASPSAGLASIEDLRVVQSPRKDFATRQYELVVEDGSQAVTSTAVYPSGQTWPSQVESAWARVDIPAWATRMRIVLTWSGVLAPGGAATGYVWVQAGKNSNPDRRVTQARKWATGRDGWRATGDVAIPASMRGTAEYFFPRATRLTGSNVTAPVLDSSSGLDLLVEFYDTAV